jgi:hypothetical protein
MHVDDEATLADDRAVRSQSENLRGSPRASTPPVDLA